MLIRKNANVNHLDRSSMSALHKAVIHDRPDCVEALMEGKADPNVVYLGDTPLSIAARHNRDRICKILLNYKETNVNHRNEQGGTALHFACAALVDSPTCVEMLVKSGAKVNSFDLKLNTPLMVCAFFNKPKIMQYLLKEGADPSPRNNEDKDALDVAIEKELVECKEILMKAFEKFQRITPRATELANDFEDKARLK
jgi:ankyrin repeat protein